MQKITTFLWFNDNLEEAIHHYVSIFKNTKIGELTRMQPGGPVFSATFELEGHAFYAINGGPMYQFTEAISLFVNCDSQEEVDELWSKLSAGGKPSRCGWLKDKFGLSWQIIPAVMGRLMRDPDPVKAKRVMQAMMKMEKINIAQLQEAYDHE